MPLPPHSQQRRHLALANPISPLDRSNRPGAHQPDNPVSDLKPGRMPKLVPTPKLGRTLSRAPTPSLGRLGPRPNHRSIKAG
jgi:hypothetical protein